MAASEFRIEIDMKYLNIHGTFCHLNVNYTNFIN